MTFSDHAFDSGKSPGYSNDRFVPLGTVFNFRDLGGHTGADGRKVRTGLLYRSDQFGNASHSDITHLVDHLGLRTVVDLRRPAEISATASFPKDRGVNVRDLELLHIGWENIEREVLTEATTAPFLVQRYSAMIESGAESIRQTLELACDATPLVFHCMAGKDRTGIIAAVILELLGVAREDIIADYAVTAKGMERYFEWSEATGNTPARGPAPLPEAMDGLLRNIDAHFGSTEKYARAIGFQRAADLRQHLLT